MAEGNDNVILYLEKERAKKVLPANWNVKIQEGLVKSLCPLIGENNIKVTQKGLKI